MTKSKKGIQKECKDGQKLNKGLEMVSYPNIYIFLSNHELKHLWEIGFHTKHPF